MSLFKKNTVKNILIRGNEGLIKPFRYNKNECHLAFSLDIESKKKLNDFKDCLEGALEDIQKYINKL